MFEHKSKQVLSWRNYAWRQVRFALISALIVLFAISLGVAGYRTFEHRSMVDSIYAATMILTGMGPAFEMTSDAGKLFASAYAIFSAAVFLTAVSVMLSPALHRMLHTLHMEESDS